MTNISIYFISVYNNYNLYCKCVKNNQFITMSDEIECICFDNTVDNIFISKRYNQFLDVYNYSVESWFIFCHNDWELREDITKILSSLSRDTIYGPIGAYAHKCDDGSYLRKWYGGCYEKNRDGGNERFYKCSRNRTGILVDTLDCQCMIVHSSLVSKYGLRFDENLAFDLYIEDFCLNAKNTHDIDTRTLSIECCHWSQLKNFNAGHSYFHNLDYVSKKYSNGVYAGVVSLLGNTAGIQAESVYPPRVYPPSPDAEWDFFLDSIRDGASVLDLGTPEAGYHKGLIKKGCQVSCLPVEWRRDFTLAACASFPGHFDYIICPGLFCQFAEPVNLAEWLRPFLKEDGLLLVSLPNAGHLGVKMSLLLDDFSSAAGAALDEKNIRYFTQRNIATLASDAGFIIEEMQYKVGKKAAGVAGRPWRRLPFFVNWFIYCNPQSFISTYFLKLKPSSEHHAALEEHNDRKMRLDYGALPEDITRPMKREFFPRFWLFWQKLKRRNRK